MQRQRTMSQMVSALLVACVILTACGKHQVAPKPNSSPVTITVNPSKHQGTVTDQSIGLSFEAAALNETPFQKGNLANYLKSLGKGVIRIGGNSSDESFWTSTNEPPPSWATTTLTPDSLTNLARVATASGWRVVLGVNLKHLDAARAADEAKHASQILGPSLLAIAIGNEPEQYYSDATRYFTDFASYVTSIKGVAPNVGIAGGDIQNPVGVMKQFITEETAMPNINYWTRHFYPTHACDGNRTSIGQLLSTTSDSAYTNATTTAAQQGAALHLPAFLDETNSTACEGQHGVSDTLASALWAMQSASQAGRANVASIDFHSTVGACNATPNDKPEHFYYSPLCAPNDHAESAGDLAATPEYYGLLAERLAGNGTVVDTASSAAEHIRAFAIASGTQITVILLNIDDPSTAGSTPVTIQLGKTFSAASTITLKTTSTKGLSATNGFQLGSSTVDANGNFKNPRWMTTTTAGSSFQALVAPATATIIRFS